jgi:L-fuconolactonase
MRSIAAHPDRLYGVGLMDFFDSEATVRESVRRVVSPPRMLGVRLHAALEYEAIPTEVNRHSDWIRDDRLDPVLDELATQDASAFVFPTAPQLSMVAELAEKHPAVPFVVDHIGWPDEKTEPDAPPWADFEAVADRPNTYVKVVHHGRFASAIVADKC